ncbi:hypothetical protein HanIR_Chr11g0504801 [Helianthus annuus]|nr:hypothetical protein HanIR_Chr11g0504801 [Helianthus annuus]
MLRSDSDEIVPAISCFAIAPTIDAIDNYDQPDIMKSACIFLTSNETNITLKNQIMD